jgi:hypothetical protein
MHGVPGPEPEQDSPESDIERILAKRKADPDFLALNKDVRQWVERCIKNPKLRAAIKEGLSAGLEGQGLTDFLWADGKGFGANDNANAFHSSVASRMRSAIEYLNSTEGPTQVDRTHLIAMANHPKPGTPLS